MMFGKVVYDDIDSVLAEHLAFGFSVILKDSIKCLRAVIVGFTEQVI